MSYATHLLYDRWEHAAMNERQRAFLEKKRAELVEDEVKRLMAKSAPYYPWNPILFTEAMGKWLSVAAASSEELAANEYAQSMFAMAVRKEVIGYCKKLAIECAEAAVPSVEELHADYLMEKNFHEH